MKFLTIFFSFMIIGINGISQKGQSAIRKARSDADYYWETMPKNNFIFVDENGKTTRSYLVNVGSRNYLSENTLNCGEDIIINRNVYDELYNRYLREWGIYFWEKFPNDPRRFEWLRLTMIYSPKYFLNITDGAVSECNENYIVALDTVARGRWLAKYDEFREEYLSSSDVTISAKCAFLKRELTYDLMLERWRMNETDKFDYLTWIKKSVYYAKQYNPNALILTCDWIFTKPQDFGLDSSDLLCLITALKFSGIATFRDFAKKKEILMKLKGSPLQLRGSTFEGHQFDLNNYRGKIVLVDFWSIGCSSCIARMPEIKQVYDKYRNKGFEVVSACFIVGDGIYKNEESDIINIHKKIGAGWPLIFLGKPWKDEIWVTYGFQSVPQLMLLNERGTLIHYNNELYVKGGIESIVERYLSNRNK